jgi:NAD(P)-dependent dehydrogenase (short-subunit alcohol dehydrogenase family)
MDGYIAGKRVLVTGGTRGIGRAIVLSFARHGAVVYTCGRAESAAGSQLRAELAELGGGHVVDSGDMGVPEDCRSLVERAVKSLEHIDVLVNNAGAISHHPIDQLGRDDWNRVLEVNLGGTYEVTRAALPHIPAGGSIINVASAVALVGMPTGCHYTAAKAAVIGFTRSLSKEIGPRGVRANVVSPGIVDTDQAAGLSPEGRKRYEQMAALRRLGAPDDVADVVLFLASDLSRFMSGQTLVVDGGI